MPRPPNYLEIYVGNISPTVCEQDLESAFQVYNVCWLKIYRRGIRTFSFLELDNEHNVKRAVQEMNGFSLKGKDLTVRAANSKLQVRIQQSIQEEALKCATSTNNDDNIEPPPLEAVCNVEPSVKEINGSFLKDEELTIPPANCQLQEHVLQSVQKEASKCVTSTIIKNNRSDPPTLEAVCRPYSSTAVALPANYLEIFVGNITPIISEKDLRSAFQDYNVRSIKILPAVIRVFGFLELDSVHNVERAVKEMNGFVLKGKDLHVSATNSTLQDRILKSIQEESAICASSQRNNRDNGKEPPPVEGVCVPCSSLECLKAYNLPTTLVVANFPEGTTEEELLRLFRPYYPIKITVVLNELLEAAPKERTYAYVSLINMELATKAVSELDNMIYKNKELLVTYMLERVLVRKILK